MQVTTDHLLHKIGKQAVEIDALNRIVNEQKARIASLQEANEHLSNELANARGDAEIGRDDNS